MAGSKSSSFVANLTAHRLLTGHVGNQERPEQSKIDLGSIKLRAVNLEKFLELEPQSDDSENSEDIHSLASLI